MKRIKGEMKKINKSYNSSDHSRTLTFATMVLKCMIVVDTIIEGENVT